MPHDRATGAGICAALVAVGLAATVTLAGCSEGADSARSAAVEAAPRAAAAIRVRDDAGRIVRLDRAARRIVSLVPSVSESIVAIGAGSHLVGRTRYDTAPELAGLPSVGGGLDPSLEALVALRPDLVIGWDAAQYRGLAPGLGTVGIPFYAARIEDTTGVFRTLERLGVLLDARRGADRVARALRDTLAAVAAQADAARGGAPRPAVFYLLPGDPPQTAGSDTFIGQIIRIAGGEPAFPELPGDWPEVSLEAVLARQPDIVIIPEEEDGEAVLARLVRGPGWREMEAVREGRVIAVPADLFQRPGPGLGEAARFLADTFARIGRRTRAER
ncbi:MAG TPA: helical backbone metal receptor [Gemmatimonadota bacterium]|nr:helical backbone metal receptor [Gemmatimonadota bacterium]